MAIHSILSCANCAYMLEDSIPCLRANDVPVNLDDDFTVTPMHVCRAVIIIHMVDQAIPYFANHGNGLGRKHGTISEPLRTAA